MSDTPPTPSRGLLRRLGPGLITAAVVLGPGTIVSASRAGAEVEYRLVWLLLLACILMATYTAMGARLGCALPVTPIEYLRQRWGRLFALVVGLSGCFVCAGFQFGNNLGVTVAMQGVFPDSPGWMWPLLFTFFSLMFLFLARQLYQFLEKFMVVLVAIMILAFFGNLFWTGLDLPRLALGVIPRGFSGGEVAIAGAMLATTFSAMAAFYQAYLVQAKGWTKENIGTAIGDAWIGIAILGTISLVIMVGAAQALYGNVDDLENVQQLSSLLSAVLGSWALWIFSFGLGAASFSSFIANALIGGSMLADGLGLDARLSSLQTRLCTVLIMLVGALVAVGVLAFGRGGTTSLLIAQSSTLIAAPLAAILLFVLTSSRAIMGDQRNGPVTIVLGVLGLLLIFWLDYRLLMRLLG